MTWATFKAEFEVYASRHEMEGMLRSIGVDGEVGGDTPVVVKVDVPDRSYVRDEMDARGYEWRELL